MAFTFFTIGQHRKCIWIPFICHPINWKYSLCVPCLSHLKKGSRNDGRGGRERKRPGGAPSEIYCWFTLRIKLTLGLSPCDLQLLYKMPHKYVCVPLGVLFHKLGKWNLSRGNVVWNRKPASPLNLNTVTGGLHDIAFIRATPNRLKKLDITRSCC